MQSVARAAPTKVIIVGGGIGGLTAALALLRRGIDVDVYEQSTVLKEAGAGVQLGSNGTRVLYALGLEDALSKVQVVPAAREIRHWRSGETWNWFDLGATTAKRFGTPHIMLHRGDLLGILADAVQRLKADAISLGRKCVAVSQTTDRGEVRFADGHVATAGFVIGADGIHSQVRACLFGAGRAEFTGCVAWRGLVPMDRLPPQLARMVGTNWLGPRGHVLHYPVRRGELMNFISIVERDDWQVESWTVEGTKGELANDFRFWHPDVHVLIDGLGTPYKWALMVRGPMERWTDRRITLLGDACHPTLPFLGQGAVMAIEDAYVVAACVSKYAKEPTVALERYQDVRRDRTAAVVRKAHENRRQVFSPELADEDAVAISVARDWQQVRLRERMDWLYTYDATAVEI
jgi:salicylate hydroxylase